MPLVLSEARDREWQRHQLGHMQVCTSLNRQISTPASHHSVFTGRMPFLPPNQQRQSTEGIHWVIITHRINYTIIIMSVLSIQQQQQRPFNGL